MRTTPPPTTTHDHVALCVGRANDAYASIARYDERLACDMRERDARSALREREQRERRETYGVFLAAAPLTYATRERSRPPARPNAWTQPPPRVARVAPTLGDKGKPEPNAWETRDVHLRTHLAADRACHHPLVKCSHKW